MTGLRLTVAQQGVRFAQQLDPQSAAFVTAERLELHGPVDEVALATAIRATIDEADVLHVRVADHDGEPCQQRVPDAGWALQIVDLRDEPDPQAAADRWTERALERPIDLTCDPLFSEALLRVADDRVLWFQRVHHLAVDAVGLQLIARRAADRYAALIAGRDPEPSPFPPLECVVDAESEYRASAAAARDREFWEARWNADAPPVAALGDRPLGPVRACIARALRCPTRRSPRCGRPRTARGRAGPRSSSLPAARTSTASAARRATTIPGASSSGSRSWPGSARSRCARRSRRSTSSRCASTSPATRPPSRSPGP